MSARGTDTVRERAPPDLHAASHEGTPINAGLYLNPVVRRMQRKTAGEFSQGRDRRRGGAVRT